MPGCRPACSRCPVATSSRATRRAPRSPRAAATCGRSPSRPTSARWSAPSPLRTARCTSSPGGGPGGWPARLDFSLVGVLHALTGPLAAAGVSIFALSTYDTDYLLVPGDAAPTATAALRDAGHDVESH
nr:ACT domain-containing protein [Angustibacter aerolatus]